jgi:hypothetical protein
MSRKNQKKLLTNIYYGYIIAMKDKIEGGGVRNGTEN